MRGGLPRQTSGVTSAADDRLLTPYRAVRRVTAGDGAPWTGLLVRLSSGESRILVDARAFDSGWAGWLAPVDGHLLAPLDIVRRSDGHDVVLTTCVERVADFLARRAAARVPLSVGETVTLGVSLVRGIAEWDEAGRGAGEWWLTDAGRPTLAPGVSELDAGAHTADLLRSLMRGTPCSDALALAVDALAGPRLSVHDLRDAEEGLFAVATAEPLATTVLGSRSARDLTAFERSAAPVTDEVPGRTTWADALARHVDADLADAVSRATTGVWRRLRTRRERSRRPWILAAVSAAVVLAAGLLWPTGAGGPATADAGVVPNGVDRPGVATGAPQASPADTGAVADPASQDSAAQDDAEAVTDLAAITDRLLLARTACAGDEACLTGVVVDPASVFESGVIDLEPSGRTISLLDDFGGVAVLRVDPVPAGEGAQLVVIMLSDDRWLLRDIHPAKQP